MKTENLISGQVFKNYKELCSVLEIEVKSGNTKIAQLKELERHCSYHKEGNKFVIDEIYNEVKEKVDNRKIVKDTDKRRNGNNNERAKAIRYLLVNLLNNYKSDYGTVGFSKYQLLKKLNLINVNYKTAKGNREEYATSLEVPEVAIDECIDLVDNYSINAIKKAIDTLRRNSTLLYRYSYTYVTNNDEIIHCSKVEEKTILLAEKLVMEQMNIRSKSKIYEFGRWEEFKRKVKYLLNNNKDNKLLMTLDVKYYYNSFHFTFDKTCIEIELNNLHRKGMSYELANELIKGYWVDRLDNTIEYRYNTNMKYVLDNNLYKQLTDLQKEKEDFKTNKNYIKDMKKVKNSITDLNYKEVNIKTEQIKFNIDDLSDTPF